MLLWNALVRSTLTYALQTHEITEHGQKTHKQLYFCMRQTNTQPILVQRKNMPQRRRIHIELKQPTTVSWIKKLRMKHMITQTHEGWNIHNNQSKYATNTLKEWKSEWQKQLQKIQSVIEHGGKSPPISAQEKTYKNTWQNTHMVMAKMHDA